ncbi:GNAT family N-acetyltransferase [Ktedonosporobacter rubrisoli]|uniref:GNAT family N-acetyltransferase n=1 Tax=Ktedonosporobacter rubrisoli TaxID=2509675 RepID=A0A4P6JWX9_KTERU|nr:GNAT family N-acetyltransferase [Ktedonosporobacter rubrisoli]QBD79912.1 GNAT family N-acetyltransferase [Ktedonosporobacter rubrisoli]
MTHIEVRVARAEDREAVLAFCQDTWDWGDYIDMVWEEWLNDPQGQLLVASVDGVPVALSHMQMLTETDAWLEGLRVHPDYRRQGLAKALNDALLVEAMRRGATYARLAIHAENQRSIEITERNFWRRAGGFILYSAPAVATTSEAQERTQLATPADLEEIIDYLNMSNIFPSVGGLYYVDYRGYSISDALLQKHIEEQHVYLLRRWDRLDGLAIAEPATRRKGLSLGYIDGTAIESISLIAYDLRHRAADLQMENVLAYAPDLVLVRDAFDGVEYSGEDAPYYCYERSLL